jgi:hypothetical protein
MPIRKFTVAVFVCVVLLARVTFAACPVERGPVKSGTDAQALDVRGFSIPATIASLHSIPKPPRPLPHDGRIAPLETTIHAVQATLVAYRLTPQGEIQLVLSDEERRTIVATIPSLQCAAGSQFLTGITSARSVFERSYRATEEFTEVRRGVEVQGVGFFDYLQSQRGLAPNGLSLYPVTAINLRPFPPPKAPPPPGRRRAVGSGGTRGCTRPTMSLAVSRGSVCAGDSVTIAWTASDPAARVTIDGIGVALPATGTRTVTTNAVAVYSGRATTSCGDSDEALALVTLTPGASASLTGPSSVTSGRTATLSVFMSAASSWHLSSSLANSISPSTGTASGTATYNANRTGNDTVTLTTTGGACGNLMRTLNISVGDPPTTGGLQCCDGTRSPSCFSCSNKQGCCSSHGGVCGCP